MSRADVIFHGHFYQPPRENPWTDEVEREWSADPFHDWNQRIHHECYAANATSRIHDAQGRVESILDNYEWISFNFGPTLLRWMERHDPATLERIVDADRRSRERWDGHGNAIAQTYNHMILPLADDDDVRTQITWARREFESRFGRRPEGFWLAETAASHRVLDELARQRLRFVILAPQQAARVRPLDGSQWTDVRGEKVDPSRAYLYRSEEDPSLSLALFFYDRGLGAACSFGKALSSGDRLADQFEAAFDAQRDHHQLLHVAVDGETAGHHVRWGNLALSWALGRALEKRGFRLTNYSRYLSENPPTFEARLEHGPYGEGSSWSCAHGVGRWIRDCGCRLDPGAPTQQRWRTPLRQALDLLRDGGRRFYREQMEALGVDADAARDDYVRLLLAHDPRTRQRFLQLHGAEDLDEERTRRLFGLLEMQHQAQLMYTSCGWFFDDVGGLETVQILRYAARCLEVWEELGGEPPREAFLAKLAEARSNDRTRGTGADIFRRDAQSARVTAERAVAHLAMLSVLEAPPEQGRLGLHRYERSHFHLRERGGTRLVTGRFVLEHTRTLAQHELSVAMLHTGGLEFLTGVAPLDEAAFDSMQQRLHEAFDQSGDEAIHQAFDRCFGAHRYGVEDLLESGKQELLGDLFSQMIRRFGENYAHLYDEYRPVLASLRELGMELPDELRTAISFALRRRFERDLLGRSLESLEHDGESLRELLREARRQGIRIDSPESRRRISGWLVESIETAGETAARSPEGAAEALRRSLHVLDIAEELGLDLDHGEAQVALHTTFLEDGRRPAKGSPAAEALRALAQRLGFADAALS